MELERLLRAVRRRWYVVLALIVAGAMLGSLAESRRNDRFTATSTVAVAADRTVYGSEAVLERIVLNEMERMRSADLTDDLIPTDAADVELTVVKRPDSGIVDLRVTSADPATAIKVANNWADTYTTDVEVRKTAEPAAALHDMRADLSDVEARLALSNARIQQELTSGGATFQSLRAILLSDPSLAVDQQLLTREARTLRASINTLQGRLNTIVDSPVVSHERGPIAAERTGNGLGPIHGALIGLGVALALISSVQRSALSLRSALAFSETVWPSRARRRHHDLDRLGVELLRNVSRDRLPLVAFAGLEGSEPSGLRDPLARHFADLGFDVTVLGDPNGVDDENGVVVLPRERLGDVVDLAVSGRSDLSRSLVFADLADLWSRRSIVKSTSVVALVNLDGRTDAELDSARSIARASAIAPNVLTLVS